MCGLVGIAGDLVFKDELTMKRLFMLDYFRGPDSTGFAAVRTNGDVKLAKLAANPLDLFEHSKFKDALNGLASTVFLGHNRAATRGAVNNINAHPFHFGHIVGAHNGTLETSSTTALEGAVDEKHGVDSMALFDAISKLGIEEAIKLCTEGKDAHTGAWSLVWYNQDDNTINFLRNKHRPMWYSWTKDFKKLLWASEWQMIDAAVSLAADGTYELYQDKEGHRYFGTPENAWLKLDVAVLKAGSDKLPKFKSKVVKGKEPAPVLAVTGHAPFVHRVFTSTVNGSPSKDSKSDSTTTHGVGTRTSISTTIDKVNNIALFGSDTDPLAGYLDSAAFYEMSKYGCAWCEDPVDYADPGITIIETQGIVLCDKCSGNKSDNAAAPPTRIYVHPQTMGSLL